jgi:hypothetical protein
LLSHCRLVEGENQHWLRKAALAAQGSIGCATRQWLGTPAAVSAMTIRWDQGFRDDPACLPPSEGADTPG